MDVELGSEKAEHQGITLNCGVEKVLWYPMDRKEISPVHSEGDQPGIFWWMMLKLKFRFLNTSWRVDHVWKGFDADIRQRKGTQRMIRTASLSDGCESENRSWWWTEVMSRSCGRKESEKRLSWRSELNRNWGNQAPLMHSQTKSLYFYSGSEQLIMDPIDGMSAWLTMKWSLHIVQEIGSHHLQEKEMQNQNGCLRMPWVAREKNWKTKRKGKITFECKVQTRKVERGKPSLITK